MLYCCDYEPHTPIHKVLNWDKHRGQYIVVSQIVFGCYIIIQCTWVVSSIIAVSYACNDTML